MSLYKIAALLTGLLLFVHACEEVGESDYESIKVEVVQDERRIDVSVGEDIFTSYAFTDTLSPLKKPVLYPVYTSRNSEATRGYPISPRAGEQVNHPNQIGLWLSHGNVNDVDFWKAGDPEAGEGNFGTIRHHEIIRAESGDQEGIIEVEKQWEADNGTHLLTEETLYVFRSRNRFRSIDRITTLTAPSEHVELGTHDGGLLAFRAAKELELPTDEPMVLIDEYGQPTEITPGSDNRNGVFINSESGRDLETHGQRADWLSLSAIVDFEPVTIAILNHPENPGSPPYWNAQSYGLMSSHPFQPASTVDEDAFRLSIGPGSSETFRYRIIVEADLLIASKINEYYDAFVREVNR